MSEVVGVAAAWTQMRIAPEQQRLVDALAGTWLGELESYPSPWDPHGGTAIGRTQCRPALAGQVLTSDYAEERDGVVVFRGHGVYAWDALHGVYRMYWFDTVVPCPLLTPASGTWEGDELTFHIRTDVADHRYVYEMDGPGRYGFRIDIRRDGEPWKTYVRGVYARQ